VLHIAICDDETNICAELERSLLSILSKLSVKHEIDVFFSGEDLHRKMKAGIHYDLIFLDIEFKKSNSSGIDIGRIIRDVHQNHLASIVYISWENKYAMQLFDVQPFNFLVKPLEHSKIEEVIGKYLKIAGLWSGEFSYKIGHDNFKVPIVDVAYLESSGRKLIIHLANGRHEEFYGSLKAAYDEQLKKFDFLFIHNSYIVNYDFIIALKFDEVVLANITTPLPISRRRRNQVRESYFKIMKKRV